MGNIMVHSKLSELLRILFSIRLDNVLNKRKMSPVSGKNLWNEIVFASLQLDLGTDGASAWGGFTSADNFLVAIRGAEEEMKLEPVLSFQTYEIPGVKLTILLAFDGVRRR